MALCAFNLVLRFTWTLTFLGALPGRGGGMFCIEVLTLTRTRTQTRTLTRTLT